MRPAKNNAGRVGCPRTAWRGVLSTEAESWGGPSGLDARSRLLSGKLRALETPLTAESARLCKQTLKNFPEVVICGEACSVRPGRVSDSLPSQPGFCSSRLRETVPGRVGARLRRPGEAGVQCFWPLGLPGTEDQQLPLYTAMATPHYGVLPSPNPSHPSPAAGRLDSWASPC